MMLIKKWRHIGLIAWVFLLIGCTTVQLSYRFLDDLMRWQLNDYVSLDAEQSQRVDAALDTFHLWHRQEQLPVYAAFLQQQITLLQAAAPTKAQLQAAQDRMIVLLRASSRKLLPEVTALLLSLNDAQRAEITKNIALKDEEYREKHIRPSLKKRRQKRQKRMLEQLEKWVGEPTDQQRERVKVWRDSLNYETTARLQQRVLVHQHIERLLTVKQAQQLKPLAERLILFPEKYWTPAYKQYATFNQQRTFELLIDLYNTLTSEQKSKLLRKLEGFRTDFLKLNRKV